MLKARYHALINRAAKKLGQELAASLDSQVVAELSTNWAKDASFSGEALTLAGLLVRWRKRALATSAGCTITAIAVLGIAAKSPAAIRAGIMPLSLGAWIIADKQRKSAREILPIASALASIQAAKSAASLAALWEKQSPQVIDAVPITELKPTFNLFDWQQFETNPDKFAHLAVVGGTGDGKSYLSVRLGAKIFSGKTIVVAPHWKPGDWEGFPVYATGRNYGSSDDSPVNFDSLIEKTCGSISAASVIFTLYEEMDRRYKLYEQGETDFLMVNVILDELLATLDEVPELAKPLKKLWREARKVRIRLCGLIQDDSVEALKIKGEGLVRKNLRYVRLGEFAKNHAKKLGNEALSEWVASQKHPILVEDEPAVCP